MITEKTKSIPNKEAFIKEVLEDFRLACESREASLLGRKEVLTGKAKFGIFGDGKEIAQLALAKSFKNGDIRSGYYRDQTWMFAAGAANVQQFFAQLYADPIGDNDPFSFGRQMNAHFATPFVDENGDWLDLTARKNSSADTSPTASQMSRSVGLALASKLYRNNPELPKDSNFTTNGDEVIFATIGDASTSEGVFWEAVNAAGVLRIPLAISIWDDGYGISVPQKYQTTKENLSEILSGFQSNENGLGIDIYTAKGWDYAELCRVYKKGIDKIRETHVPAIFHITEVTQPQGHSTSGSHERYKNEERLNWETEFDGIEKMREWILANDISDAETLDNIRKEAKQGVKQSQKAAWKNYSDSIKEEIKELAGYYTDIAGQSSHAAAVDAEKQSLQSTLDPFRKDLIKSAKKVLRIARHEQLPALDNLRNWLNQYHDLGRERYQSHLYSESDRSAMKIEPIAAEFSDDSKTKNGFEILNTCFDNLLKNHDNVIAFGEDVGKIGDVNQGFAGLQEKYGEHRVFDVGIRENTIIGQGVGMAMRGLRPIAEIQYLDYLIYGLQTMTDDLATLQYRTKGTQKAPLIVRTRGHRLEGIWHTGSPIGMIINSLRGVYVLVPRNMTQAAGFYNTMIASDDAALIIECLNGYRLKEKLPDNIDEFRLPLGVPEVLVEGEDITVVSYGSTLRVAQEAMKQLEEVGISVELIDVQTLIPFDINHSIVESIKKTNRVLFLDEDVPGGASAFMMQEVIENQGAYFHLDSEPKTLTAMPNRSAYGSDGDYFCKPNAEDIFEAIYDIMHETDPAEFPIFY